jgi:hypothetical protein
MENTKIKMLTFVVIPLLLIPMFGVGAAHWYDYITKQYKLKAGYLNTQIISYKVLIPCSEVLIKTCPSDSQMPTKTISITTKVFPGWYCWIGLKIQNQGNLPVFIDGPQYQINDPSGVWQYFTHSEYYYGQIVNGTSCGWSPTDVPENVYAMVKLKPQVPQQVAPPPPGNIPPPVRLSAYGPHTWNTMIMWIYLKLPKDSTPSHCYYNFKLQICITITATMATSPCK